MAYDEARTSLGPDRARALWTLTEDGLGAIEELAGDAFRRSGSLRLAADEAELAEIESEFRALDLDGFAVEWSSTLPPQLSAFAGAFRHVSDGALDPALWVRRLAGLAAEAGAELREGSRIDDLEQLEARHVVLATDGYTHGLVPALDAVVGPVRNQVIVTRPLGESRFPFPHYARRGLDYWQQTPDGRLVVGGKRDAGADAELTREEALTPVIQDRLERFADQLAGRPVEVTHRWAGIFGSSPDGLPLAGPVPACDDVWVAAGYSGHGNVLGFVCGRLVAEAILGTPAAELELFDPARLL